MKTKSVAFIYVGICLFEPHFFPSMIFATHIAFAAFMVSMWLSFGVFMILQERENSARRMNCMVEAIARVLAEKEQGETKTLKRADTPLTSNTDAGTAQ